MDLLCCMKWDMIFDNYDCEPAIIDQLQICQIVDDRVALKFLVIL